MGPVETLRTIRGTPRASLVAPSATPLGTPKVGGSEQAKLHRVAKQFEAMFMSEMLHQANPKPQKTGTFRAGIGESSMRPFMDQALGDAVASRGGTGLAQSIERALTAAAAARKGK